MVCILFNDLKDTADHLLFRKCCIGWKNFIVLMAMPDLYYIVSIDANAIFINWEIAVPSGEALKSIQTLAMEMKNIGKWYVCDIFKCERHSLKVEFAYSKVRCYHHRIWSKVTR